jgi:hypothetical protein
MKRLVIAAAFALISAAPLAAQPYGGPGPGPGPGFGRGNPELRAERFNCRQEARARGYRRPFVRGAVLDCLRSRRPDLARIVECRQSARAQGYMPRTPPFRAAVRACRFGA